MGTTSIQWFVYSLPLGVNRYVRCFGGACQCQLRSHGSDLWVGFISFPLVVGNQLSGWCSASLGKHGRHAGEMALHLSACCICPCSRARIWFPAPMLHGLQLPVTPALEI